MILLFWKQASKSSASNKTNNVKNNPVENAGVLAMGLSEAKSLLTVGEYDTYISSNPSVIDYSMYSDCDFTDSEGTGFMGEFAAAVAVLGDCGFGGGDFGGASSFSGASCSSFCSVG